MTRVCDVTRWMLGTCIYLLLSFTVTVTARALTRTRCLREEEVRCMMDPCRVSDCPAFPSARCQANYCGGCNAEFFLNGIKLLSSSCQDIAAGVDPLSGDSSPKSSVKDKISFLELSSLKSDMDILSMLSGLHSFDKPSSSMFDPMSKLLPHNRPIAFKDDTEHIQRGDRGGGGGARNPSRPSRGQRRENQFPRHSDTRRGHRSGGQRSNSPSNSFPSGSWGGISENPNRPRQFPAGSAGPRSSRYPQRRQHHNQQEQQHHQQQQQQQQQQQGEQQRRGQRPISSNSPSNSRRPSNFRNLFRHHSRPHRRQG